MEMEFGEGGAQKSASAELREQNKLSDSTSVQPTGDLTIDGLGQIKRIIQNKIRNLEKKKAKLETYKEQLASGKELTEDQKLASEKLDEAERSIETQRDFLKIIQSVQNDYCKQLKTHKKKEEREKQQIDINRFRDLLRYQDVLNTLGNDEVRQDFLDGAKASVKCSKEEMALYDDMYKKLCPASEDATDWAKALDESALFAYRLVTGAPKTATGFENVTFQQLKETLDNMAFCPYFHGKLTQSSVPLKQTEATAESAEEQEHRPVEPTNSFDSSERSATPTIYANTPAPNNAPVPAMAGIPNGNNQPQLPQQQTVLPPPSAPQNQIFMTANDILASTHLTTINFLQEDQTDSRSAAVGVDYVSMVSSGAISQPSLNFNMHTGQDRNGDSQELVNNEYHQPQPPHQHQQQQEQQENQHQHQQQIPPQQYGRGGAGGSYRGRFQKEGGYRGGRGMGGRGGSGFYGGGRDRGGRGGGNFRGGYGGSRGGGFGNEKFGAAGAGGNFKESGATKA